jgi:hypothetical protein
LIITTTTLVISLVNLSSKSTFALIVLIDTNSISRNWIIVNKVFKKAKVQNQLILIREFETLFSVLVLRNTINKAFLDKSIKELIVSFITITNNKKNLVVTSTNLFTSDFLIEKRAIWKYLIIFKLILKDKF